MQSDLSALVDLPRLASWLDDEGIGAGPIGQAVSLTGGTQNLLIRFVRGERSYVLRQPPPPRAASDATVLREAAVLGALVDTDVPHPRLVAACGDSSVLGAAFLLTEAVDGFNPATGLPDEYATRPDWRAAFGLAVVDGAAAIAALDHRTLGLGEFGRPDGFLGRQVGRWQAQLDSYREFAGYRSTLAVQEIGHWLEANRPPDAPPGLVHGDLHLANVLLRHDRPALAAIVDWELATIGDPLVDLGWLLATWPTGGVAGVEPVTTIEPTEGLPTCDELIRRYGERSDRDLSHIVWYEVLACYKLAIVLEGTHARASAGLAPTATGERLHRCALGLLERGRARMSGR